MEIIHRKFHKILQTSTDLSKNLFKTLRPPNLPCDNRKLETIAGPQIPPKIHHTLQRPPKLTHPLPTQSKSQANCAAIATRQKTTTRRMGLGDELQIQLPLTLQEQTRSSCNESSTTTRSPCNLHATVSMKDRFRVKIRRRNLSDVGFGRTGRDRSKNGVRKHRSIDRSVPEVGSLKLQSSKVGGDPSAVQPRRKSGENSGRWILLWTARIILEGPGSLEKWLPGSCCDKPE